MAGTLEKEFDEGNSLNQQCIVFTMDLQTVKVSSWPAQFSTRRNCVATFS